MSDHQPPLESYSGESTTTVRKTSSGTVLAAVIGAMALIFGGLALYRAATSPAGAETPEDAVRNLLDAAAGEDVIGVLQSLEPGERDSLRGPIEDIADELKRLGVLAEGFDLQGISGIGLDFTDVALSSQELDTGIAAVSIDGGTANAAVIPEDLPLGPFFDSFFEEQEMDDPRDEEPTEESTPLDDVGFEIVAVERDGGWYVSLWYSVAEAARAGADLPLPDFGQGVRPDGAGSPEDAVRELVAAGTALDLRKVFALLPPGEASALHDYAPLFLDDAEADIAEMREEDDLEINVRDLELDTVEDGSTARVGITSFTADATFEDGSFDARYGDGTFSVRLTSEDEDMTVEYDGECFRQEGESYGDEVSEESCRGDDDFPPIPEDLRDVVPAITVVEIDGAWFVSPTRTVLDSIVQGLEMLDRDDLEDFSETMVGSFFFPFAGLSSSESYSEEGWAEYEGGEGFETPTTFRFDDGTESTTESTLLPPPD